MPTTLIAAIFLPPLALLLAALLGLVLLKSRPLFGRTLIAAGLGLLALLSTPLVGNSMLSLLEPPDGDPLRRAADAIVVLGAGTYFNAPEYGGDTVGGATLERLRYAALLYRRSRKPILASGGSPLGNAIPEAAQMKAVLQNEWLIPVAWNEITSTNTLESARNSDTILAAAGIRRIYLVTHAWHMPRARLSFEHAGFNVVPAPTRYATRSKLSVLEFLPSSDGMLQSSLFCREILGLIWYRLLLL